MNSNSDFGLIILGNSGAGKSFLANVLLGRDVFVHKFSPGSVTHKTEFQEIKIGQYVLAVFNIPGLIEAEQERIDLNKQEIDRAFSLRPNSIIMFVFGQVGGRVQEGDVVAFNAINEAYPFKNHSLLIVVNNVEKGQSSDYAAETTVLLQKLLKDTVITSNNICFLDHITVGDQRERQVLKEQMLEKIVEMRPTTHQKVREIETIRDRLRQSQNEVKAERKKFEAELHMYKEQISKLQSDFDRANAEHKSENESMKRALERQQELIEEQELQHEEAKRKYESELQAARSAADNSSRLYELILEDKKATQEQVLAAQKANQELQAKLIEVLSRPPPPPQIIREKDDDNGWCTIA